ncbi:hypothetical protein ABES03_08465 [Neobacillus rhizosphaerae]|uniref:hypothetical protein n=1 Tax=Neobacillus rhizosphaerae TaxID=2880965 RepID=UPI003D2E7649
MIDIYDWFDKLYSRYDVAFINSKTQTVRLENKKGWFEETTLTVEFAHWLLNKGVEIRYE